MIDFAEGFGGGWHGAVTIPESREYTFTASRTDEHSQPVLPVVQAWEGSEPDQEYRRGADRCWATGRSGTGRCDAGAWQGSSWMG
ncbi:hypothetical protein [Pseudactinotalea sp. Z1748]|uniref:hypothetical protein n=1 Tax=Pseudactinotalea sp. Z1748 TaxID=3413027 RepID=UPI003C7B8B91